MLATEEEPNRLRALLTLMREFGTTEIVTPDGYALRRPAPSPLEAALVAEQSISPSRQAASGATSGDDDEDIDGEAAQERELEARWYDHWRRLTLSSGAGIPPFPGREKAMRLMGAS